MASDRTLVYLGEAGSDPPQLISDFSEGEGLRLVSVSSFEALRSLMSRSVPACLILNGRTMFDVSVAACSKLKKDPFASIVPIVILASEEAGYASVGLEAGADEVITANLSDREQALRLERTVRRAHRDVSVHPTTRLPGTFQIEHDMQMRMDAGSQFAVCYADLDHFKEFNDRYGYNNGDSVILLLSRILRDLVQHFAPDGFVGHIGGDDFIFNVGLEHLEGCCDEIIELFDELTPYQYSEEDKRAGYFLGKDRRGSIHRVPMMTLSIGVVTNQFQDFTHTAQISALAAEMKTYAKTLPGSVYVVDRRQADAVMKARASTQMSMPGSGDEAAVDAHPPDPTSS